MFIKVFDDGQIKNYSTIRLKKDNPMVSFPDVISDEIFAEFNVFRVQVDVEPEIDFDTHKRVYKQPEKRSDGKWYQSIVVEKLPYEEALTNICMKRDALLDTIEEPSTEEEKVKYLQYRNELQNITEQSDIYNLTWPEQPNF